MSAGAWFRADETRQAQFETELAPVVKALEILGWTPA